MSTKESAASLLVELAISKGVYYIKDQSGEIFAVVPQSKRKQVWACSSDEFRGWLNRNYWLKYNSVAPGNALKDAIHTITSIASFEAERANLGRRIAWDGPNLYYDLGDECRNIVELSPKGWKIVTESPVMFRQSQHQLPQCLPARNGDIQILHQYLNVPSEHQRLLLLCTILSYFIPGIPHNLLMLYGPQGSTKTTTAKLLKSLIDPSASPTVRLPYSLEELSLQFYHHLVPVYDNLFSITQKQSDAMCSAVTGDSVSKRTLYTTLGQTHYSFRPCIIMTGINIVPQKADLLDRTVLIGLESLSSKARLEESELRDRFDKDRYTILGGIFDVVARSLAVQKTLTRETGRARMADAHKWGQAFAKAMGYTIKDFDLALQENESLKNQEVLACNAVASAVISLMDGRKAWKGTASELLPLLKSVASVNGYSTRMGEWPQAPHSLVKSLNESMENLRRENICIRFRRAAIRKEIFIESVPLSANGGK